MTGLRGPGGALEAQDAEEAWTEEERLALASHLEQGYLQAERGELIDGDQARREIEAMKDDWRTSRVEEISDSALTPLDKADIFQIWIYIAEHNEDAVNRVERAIYEACAFVADAPLRGHTSRDLTRRSPRFWTLTRYPNYIFVYRPETKPIQVVAVVHGKRNIKRVLKVRPG